MTLINILSLGFLFIICIVMYWVGYSNGSKAEQNKPRYVWFEGTRYRIKPAGEKSLDDEIDEIIENETKDEPDGN